MISLSDQSSRQLVALNADIVGYSRLLADDFEATTEAVNTYRQLVEDEVTEVGGILVNFVGDNFMAVFDQATQAIRAAISITKLIEDHNLDLQEHSKVRFRMGLDRGEIFVSDDGSYFGDALNIAARIQAIAPSGGISVSGNVYRDLDEPALRFRPIGRKDLKNIPEKVEVYEFADLPTDESHHRQLDSLGLGSPSIAVLPPHAENTDTSIRGLADLIRSDLIHKLAQIPNFDVVEMGTEIDRTGSGGAPYMLESGIHQMGNQLRIYAKLIEVSTLNVVSSHRWDAATDELLALADTMTDEVARAVEIELVVGEPGRFYIELDDPVALHDIYQGWYHFTSGQPEDWLRSVEYFQRVVESHPDAAVGHGLLAFAHWVAGSEGLGDDPAEHLTLAVSEADRVIEIGDPTGLGHMVHAAVLLAEGKADEALERVETAEISRPTCDITYAMEGSIRRYLGQWEKSVGLLDKAMRLSPVNKPWYPTVQACALYIGGKLEQAAATAEEVLDHQPRNLEALLVLAAAQKDLGLERRARATGELIRERFSGVDVGAWLASNPYQDARLLERWRGDLASVGVITPTV